MGQSFTIRILPSRSIDLRLDLARPVGVEHFERRLAVQNLLADFRARSAGRANRSSRGQPSGGLVFSHDFSSGLSDHLGVKPGVLADLVELIEDEPTRPGGICQGFLCVFDRLVHRFITLPDVIPRQKYKESPAAEVPNGIKALKLLVVRHRCGVERRIREVERRRAVAI